MNIYPTIGIDFGNVIIDHKNFGTTKSYVDRENYNLIPPVQDAFSAIRLFNEDFFKNRIFILYNATDIVDAKIFGWLEYNGFFAMTGIGPTAIIRSRNGRDKSRFCIEKGVTHFIDDRLEVLGYLVGNVSNLFLYDGQEAEINAYRRYFDFVSSVSTWNEIINLIYRESEEIFNLNN